jgi:hypothetical protein
MNVIIDGESEYQEKQSPPPSGVSISLENMNIPEPDAGQHQVESVDTPPQPEANLDVPIEKFDRSMRAIMPGTSSCALKVIHTIKLLDEFLSLSSTRQVIDKILTPIGKVGKKKRPKKAKQKVGNDDQQDQQPLQQLPEILNNADAIQSLRFIQAGRYEIFVQARGKKAYVFDWLCEQVWSTHQNQQAQTDDTPALESYNSSQEMKQAIIQYAIQQAERDDRITGNIKNKRNMSYDNFSLIVSYDPVVAQPKHIDLLYPNFQYGLIITDKSPGTTVYTTPHSIKTVTDLKNHVWTDMPSTISRAMEQDAIVTSLLSQFGAVLCPNIEEVQYWKPCNNSVNGDESQYEGAMEEQQGTSNDESNTSTLEGAACFPTGTLLSLPGSEIHAGPSSSKYRTVLFFSACPDVTNTIPYHPDTQYFGPLLCCDFVSLLWNNLCIVDRIYLLNRLIESINDTKCQHLERHIADLKMIRFLKMVTNWDEQKKRLHHRVSTYKKYKTMNDYIHAFAFSGKSIEAECIGIDVIGSTINNYSHAKNSQPERTSTENVIPLDCQNTTANVISSSNLVVEFEGEYFPAHVLEHPPAVSITSSQNIVNVMLYYPLDQSWEGIVNPYTLEWKQEQSTTETVNDETEMLNKRRLFDGINGILRDDEGIVVPCYPPSLTSVPSHENDSVMKTRRKTKKRRKSTIPYSVRPRKYVKTQKIHSSSSPISVESNAPPIRDTVTNDSNTAMHKKDSIRESQVVISTVNAVDVICGLQGPIQHPGNRSFLDLVKLFSSSFEKRARTERLAICNSIIKSVHNTNGRFIRRDSVTGLLHELNIDDAQNRCYRALLNQSRH